MFIKTVLVLFALSGAIFTAPSSGPKLTKCKPDDSVCITKSAKEVFLDIAAGIPSMSVETFDPMFFKEIKSDISGLKYDLNNVTVTGMKSCQIENVNLSLKLASLHFDLYCPLLMEGVYTISGRLLILPIEGTGAFTIVAKKMHFNVNGEIKQVKGKDGKVFLDIAKFTSAAVPDDQVRFTMENLFGGNKELSDRVHTLANDNYKDVIAEVGGPVFDVEMEKVMTNLKSYFKAVPLEELVVL